jgi:hypothetical protein
MKKSIVKILAFASLTFAFVAVSCSDDDSSSNGPTSTFVLDRDNLKGEINDGEVVLESGTYKLTNALVVKDGAKLTIKAGVVIQAADAAGDATQGGIVPYIVVAQGGKIDVQGTANSPVVMTSTTKEPGKWGGLVICGKAPINKGATANAEVSGLLYGGTDAADNSGSIKYLRIEYPGYIYSNAKEFNGLSFFGVGNGTVVENVQVLDSSDDGFEWFGGTVNTKNLVVINKSTVTVGDDMFDWTEGWSGTNENWYGKRTNGGNRGIEADNNANNHNATPIANPTIKNVTLVGTGDADTGSEAQGIKLRVGTKAQFDNVVLSNWKTGFDVENDESIAYVANGMLKAINVRFENVTTKAKGKKTDGSAADVNAIFGTESTTATGAGNGAGIPTWSTGWTAGM